MPGVPTDLARGVLRAPAEVIERLRRDVERNALRARNGVKLVAGIGRPNLGQTPRALVWSSGHAQLWRYQSDRVSRRPPLLLVYSLVSKSYVLDLQPGNSFVEHLQSAGFDVFLLDWVPADGRHANERLENYADHYLPEAVRKTLESAGNGETVNLFGYCLGGVLTLLYAAHHPEAPLRSLTVMATPVDFSKFELARELGKDGRLPVEALLDENGNVPAGTIRQFFRLLKPTAEVRQYATLLDRIWDDEFVNSYQALFGWSDDHVALPGAAAGEILEMIVRENGLIHGTVRLRGDTVHLEDIRVPMLTIIAERDHIVPEPVAAPLPDLVGSKESEVLRLNAGHVGLIVGRTAARVTIPRIVEFLTLRSESLAAAA